VFPSGIICLSILKEEEAWRPAITVKHILLGALVLHTLCTALFANHHPYHHQNLSARLVSAIGGNNFPLISALCCVVVPPHTGVQELLTSPNPNSPAQREAYEDYVRHKARYSQKVRAQAARCVADTDTDA
jgi:ubiquitin-conjugating enzyme E2 I